MNDGRRHNAIIVSSDHFTTGGPSSVLWGR